jgi:hypothetical protein
LRFRHQLQRCLMTEGPALSLNGNFHGLRS